ncbi:MAG TPA: hypothetical protein PKC36_08840 [Dietzia sp.]|nr:hypothetical protein [Dietzia sp.]
MATIASKIQWTTAAFAVAAAATLVPVAFADPTDSDASDTPGAAVGSSAGQAPSRSSRKDRERPETNTGLQADSSASGGSASSESESTSGSTGGSSQGRSSTNVAAPSANATPSLAVGDEVTIIDVPLVADPDLQSATFGWMQNLNIDACVLGLSQRITGQQSVIGPYGTSSLSYNSSGCG